MMVRFAFCVAAVCVALQFAQAIHIEEVFVVNSTDSKIIGDVKLSVGKSKGSSGLVVINLGKNPTKKTPVATVVDTKKPRKLRNHRHLRRKCCNAGEKAAKYGLSCLIPRNFKTVFFNLVTQTRQKYQGTLSRRASHRFKSRDVYGAYKEIKMCVKRQRKSVVQKCCLGYLKKSRPWG